MPPEIKVTPTVAQVLRAFLQDPREPRYGFELMRTTGLPSGTLYPVLARLRRAGWLTAEREDIDPAAEGRPPRTLYRIDPAAAVAARQEMAALSERFRPPAPGVYRPGEGWA